MLVTAEDGYAMAALLVTMTIMAIMLSAALPAWRTFVQREKEAELVFRGEQYARAIRLFQQRYANASPPSIDVLVNERFLRKRYKDPITNDDFQVITAASNLAAQQGGGSGGGIQGQQDLRQQLQSSLQGLAQQTQSSFQAATGRAGGQPGATSGGIVGVTSKSPLKSFRLYQGRDTYNQWVFMALQQSARAGGPGGGAGQTGTGREGRGGADGRGGRDGRGGIQQPPARSVPQPPDPRGQQPQDPRNQRRF